MARQHRGRSARLWGNRVASGRADAARAAAIGRRARRMAASVGSGWREALIMAGAYGLYSLVKGLWGGSLEEGRRAAASLIDLERSLGIYVEPDLQRFFVDNHLGMPFWNAFYVVSQVVVLPLTLFLVYRYARKSYAFIRNMAVLSWTAGVVWYALQPVAPPRLLESGFTDTVSSQTFFQLDSEFIRAFYNPVAAMPSLHVGMAPVVAWALIRLTPWVWTKALGIAYPFLVAISIVVTGNHFILDIAGGLAVVLPAAAISAWLVREPRPGPGRVATALRAALHGDRGGSHQGRGPAPRT
jgi:membrane-associated phospholipid phosphatase